MKLSQITLITLLGAALVSPMCSAGEVDSGTNGSQDAPNQTMRFGRNNTTGWSLMSRDERKTYQEKMRSFKTMEDCNAYLREHDEQMSERAKARNKNMSMSKVNACERMKQQGKLQ